MTGSIDDSVHATYGDYKERSMGVKYSLVHLTDIGCPPPKMIHVAAKAGYDCVSLRTIPMGLTGEKPYDIAKDRTLLKEIRQAVEETGIVINDTENAKIFDGVTISNYKPCLEAAAELGIRHVLTNIWTDDKSFYTEKFCELCELAAQYDQTISVEFVTWASVKDMKTVKELLLASSCTNAGVVVDTLHFYRSRVDLDEFASLPREWFHFAHLCDAGKEIPVDQEALIHTGREERLYPGEGFIDIKSIIEKIPHVVRGLEIPHRVRVNELGYEEHARHALKRTKEYMGDSYT